LKLLHMFIIQILRLKFDFLEEAVYAMLKTT